jgi:gamma-glutamylcyclotransferase (GGCT)/AIG2-like uncharacterized protein YtfP
MNTSPKGQLPASHLLFVYGTLKRPYGNNHVMTDKGATFIGTALTLDKFVMFGAGIPFVWKPTAHYSAAHPDTLAYVVGEVWQVNDEGLEATDRLEGHPRFYRRTPVDVKMTEEKDTRTLKGVGMYLVPDMRGYSSIEMPDAHGRVEWGPPKVYHPVFRSQFGPSRTRDT